MAHRSAAMTLWIDVASDLAAEEVSWFAIRQPAVIKMLERELWDSGSDGDAFAVALDAAVRVAMRVSALDGAAPPRLTHAQLAHGLALARGGDVDRALARWVRWCIDAAPVALTAIEERVVLDCVAAMLWAIAAADLAGLEHGLADAVVG